LAGCAHAPAQALAALRRRLNRAIGAFDRTKHQFKQSLADAIEVDDVVLSITASAAGGDRVFRSTLRPQRAGRHALAKDKAEYWWKVRPLAALRAFLTMCVNSASPGRMSCGPWRFFSLLPPSSLS